MKKLALLMAVLFSTALFAEEISLSWTPPVGSETCTESTVDAEIGGYRIYSLVKEINDPTVTEANLGSYVPGMYDFVFTTFSTAGDQSRLSDTLTKTAIMFDVSDTTVYTFVTQEDRLVLLPVGTVPMGTTCDATQSVNGKYAVSRQQVTWSGTIEPLIVLADCV